jgi:hypothetical protein
MYLIKNQIFIIQDVFLLIKMEMILPFKIEKMIFIIIFQFVKVFVLLLDIIMKLKELNVIVKLKKKLILKKLLKKKKLQIFLIVLMIKLIIN